MAVGKRPHKKAFPAIKKQSSAVQLPQTLATIYVADLRAQLELDIIEVVSDEPATLGGVPGFKLTLEYSIEQGLRYRNVVYGATNETGLYLIEYRAPIIHFFDRDYGSFENMVSSFKFLSSG